MIFFEPKQRDRKLFPHDPFKGMVVPRPVGWVSTMSKSGALNLAPYSYFNGFHSWPQIVGFASETVKDSAAFAIETGEFVWSMATWALREQMNATSEGLPRGRSEFGTPADTAPSTRCGRPSSAIAPGVRMQVTKSCAARWRAGVEARGSSARSSACTSTSAAARTGA